MPHDDVELLASALGRVSVDYLNSCDVLGVERAVFEERLREATGDPYRRWRMRHDQRQADLDRARGASLRLPYRPLLSLVAPLAGCDPAWVRGLIDSVVAQSYDHWELCLAYDAADRATNALLQAYATADPRIKPVRIGGTLAPAVAALHRAGGEFIALVSGDGALAPHAFYETAVELNAHPDLDVIYSDSDEIDANGKRTNPYFKPGWSPDTLLSRAYIGRCCWLRRSLVDAVGGLRWSLGASMDWDLLLRASERTGRIGHIADVLYHERSPRVPDPRSDTTAVLEALARRGEPGRVVPTATPGTYVVRYLLRAPGKVTIVVPTRDRGEDVDRCLTAVFTRSTYRDFDVQLVDNGSTEPESLAVFARWRAADARLQVVRDEAPFNFSRLNNDAVARTTSPYVVLLNNDTEIITPDWLEAMLEQAQRPTIGAVGALLLYGDGLVQHAGVIVGLGGAAGHSHKHYPGDAPGYFGAMAGITNYSAVTAACMMVKRADYERAGGFDEQFSVTFNDVDFCLRLGAAGLRNVYLPHVRSYHFESKSRGADADGWRAERASREKQLLRTRWNVAGIEDPYYNPNLTRDREDYTIEA